MWCRSVYAHGFTAGQKTVENQDRAAEPPGRRAVGRGPRAAGPSDLRAAGPWRAVGRGPPGRGPAFSKTHYFGVRMFPKNCVSNAK